MNYDLSIIVPGIRNQNWDNLYEHICRGCKRYSFEIVFSGPFPLSPTLQKNERVKYLKNFGSPSRALQMATTVAEGRFVCWIIDDAHVYEDTIDQCIDLLLANDAEKDIVCMRYTEGHNHSGGEFAASYWVAGTHPDLHAPGVNREWKLPLVPLMSLSYYRELGGLDCLYEHMNLNIVDLGFRAQRSGSKILLSPTQVINCDFEPGRTVESHAVIAAFHEHDRPLFWEMYREKDLRPIRIKENWQDCPVVWPRRSFG